MGPLIGFFIFVLVCFWPSYEVARWQNRRARNDR